MKTRGLRGLWEKFTMAVVVVVFLSFLLYCESRAPANPEKTSREQLRWILTHLPQAKWFSDIEAI
jgi:hypothetical protein